MILIGSRAIKYWFLDFPREPKDWDYAVSDSVYSESVKGETINGERVEYLLNPVLTDYPHYHSSGTVTPDVLYTLKISHLFWDIKWDKHMFDVQFLKKKGCQLIHSLFQDLFDYWESYHGPRKHSDLTLSAEEFFDNVFKGKYDHDHLHTLLNATPTYTKVLKDGSEVEPSEEKFNMLSHQEKLDLVREEVMVMGYERRGNRKYYEVYSWMLKRFIRNHAPIWEALFIIDNYIELHKPQFNFIQKLDYELSRSTSSVEEQN